MNSNNSLLKLPLYLQFLRKLLTKIFSLLNDLSGDDVKTKTSFDFFNSSTKEAFENPSVTFRAPQLLQRLRACIPAYAFH